MHTERITLQSDVAGNDASVAPSAWWTNYIARAAAKGLSPSAQEVLNCDADYVTDKGIFGAGGKDGSFEGWPSTRLRKGLVMGAVQSGKTASLLAVVAKALDAGTSVVVVLAGTRTALWHQTYLRLLGQLDGWEPDKDSARRLERVLLPSPQIARELPANVDLDALYFETPTLVRRMLNKGRPLVAVVMKQPDHLERFAKYIKTTLQPMLADGGKPVHMLVVDDEADDGSIMDSDAERGLPVDSDVLKQIPRRIARLWSSRDPGAETLCSGLYASYLAYTATPQANLLQADHNPLSPTDFVASLRVPFTTGGLGSPRSSTFFEPLGLASYYTGGETYYSKIGEELSFCRTTDFPAEMAGESALDFESRVEADSAGKLADALRAFLVAGAVRLFHSKRSLSRARAASSNVRCDVSKECPAPHCMLVHPSAQVESHFKTARGILEWSGANASQEADGARLDAQGLCRRLVSEESAWASWLADFSRSKDLLVAWNGSQALPAPSIDDWPEIKRILIEDVFPHVDLRVINSDPRADNPPSFEIAVNGDGTFAAPRDLFTIFVSGNVMSRGLTLEGLATTVFLRSSAEPAADTQMQMQRWFGYRGPYLNLCRVFLYSDQLRLFRSYHDTDEALRSEIIGKMNLSPKSAPRPTVLQGLGYRATGKISNLKALPLSPGAGPFLRIAEDGACAGSNASMLSDLLDGNEWQCLTVKGTLRGRYMKRTLDLASAAQLLEGFRYSMHDPNPHSETHKRWQSLALQNGLLPPEAPLFRPPTGSLNTELVAPNACPYSIAAYLRLWAVLLTRKARGLCPTDDPQTPWSMIDLARHRALAPQFYVGIRYGLAGLANSPALSSRGVQRMERSYSEGVLVSSWGSRNPGESEDAYLGDQLFDYHVHGLPTPTARPGEPLWRKRGSPGLILFHVIKGTDPTIDVITAGVAVPLGGPDHIAAIRGMG